MLHHMPSNFTRDARDSIRVYPVSLELVDVATGYTPEGWWMVLRSTVDQESDLDRLRRRLPDWPSTVR